MARAAELREQLQSLQSDLEYSTFLNKGVLQSNSEYKLLIAELKNENSVLRAAESRLSDTEDQLETVTKQLEEAQALISRWKGEKKALEERCKKEVMRRKEVEVERNAWRDRYEEMKGVRVAMENVKKQMDRCLADMDEVESANAAAASRQKRQQSPPVATTSTVHATTIGAGVSSSSRKSRQRSPIPTTNSMPAASSSAVKRRRQIVPESPEDEYGNGAEHSPEADEDDDSYEDASPDAAHPHPTRIRKQALPRQLQYDDAVSHLYTRHAVDKSNTPRSDIAKALAGSSNHKRRRSSIGDALPPKTPPPKARRKKEEQSRELIDDIKFTIKNESPSPPRSGDTDDDPLAMD